MHDQVGNAFHSLRQEESYTYRSIKKQIRTLFNLQWNSCCWSETRTGWHWPDLVLSFWKKRWASRAGGERLKLIENHKTSLSNLWNLLITKCRQKLTFYYCKGFHVRWLSLSLHVLTLHNTNSETAPQLYSANRARKIKIYSHREIQNASEMVKLYWASFWDNKTEEICSIHTTQSNSPNWYHRKRFGMCIIWIEKIRRLFAEGPWQQKKC